MRAGLAATCFVAGCANPGPVRSPSLHLPAAVTDLSAERAGDTVTLRWTTPSVTTDGGAVVGPMVAEICRETGSEVQLPAARLSNCRVVHRVSVAAGPTTLTDDLTPALEADPVQLVTYRIAIYNSRERTAGYSSNAAYTAGGSAPATVAGLRSTNVEPGVALEWLRANSSGGPSGDLVQLDRLDLTVGAEVMAAPAAKASRPVKHGVADKRKTTKPTRVEVQPANETLLRVEQSGARPGSGTGSGRPDGALDTAVELGHRYRYVVERVRTVTVAGHRVEIRSAPSEAVVVERRDVFPPGRPAALEAIAGFPSGSEALGSQSPASFIDLSWEPNAEPDLQGYLVERQAVEGSQAWVMLTPVPIVPPSFRDGSVVAGRRYRYRVTAVDATGNRSAASEPAEETAVGAP